ncbi:sorting nexin Mvp1 [Aspergillus lucknowensis]|uniref:Sorting nexin MVP1 n=1 Tax=Aspergillus lucknowensis TaxID=176173 RepID=A0ABR4LLX4_9EURO
MGQGGQRAIHPFFRKDFGVSVPSLSPKIVNDSLLDPTSSQVSNGSPKTPSAAAVDLDPNINRRKRRKTNKAAEEPLDDDSPALDNQPEPDESNDSAARQRAGTSTETPDPFESPAPVGVLPAPKSPGLQQPATDDVKATHNGPTSSVGTAKKPKVIKLNANGKLLSSPVADKYGDTSKKRGNKRGKPAAHDFETRERKVVVIKYTSQQGSMENLGKQIDDILSGRKKSSTSTPAVTSTAPKASPNQPAKPTHPFFLKKEPPKSDPFASQQQALDSIHTPSADEGTKAEPTPARTTSKPLFSFKHAFVKVPEPVQPLWPPLGLSHVRDLPQNLRFDGKDSPPDIDRRKSKTPTVRINDEESVLSSVLWIAKDNAGALRVPERQICSGRVLQRIVVKQLTGTLAKNPTDGALGEASHPAIVKLYSSLGTSMTAFDRGEYETHLWAHKYAPNSAQQVLCGTKEALMLRDWLKHLVVSSVETGISSKDAEKGKRKEEKKRKRRKKADKLDGFIISSDDEASEMGEISGSDDELAGDVTVSSKRTVIRTGDLTFSLRSGTDRSRMSNAILLSGPPGCGKTASVYAVAKEMDFEVFEINSGSRRSAKDILDRLGDMTQNHLVHNVHSSGNSSGSQTSVTDLHASGSEDVKPNKLVGYFKSTPAKQFKEPGKGREKGPVKETDSKQTRNQKQSLILLEEADILFEEDKQFWSGVLALINQSKRPIIITCNNESLIPVDDISLHAILRYRNPQQDLAVDYLLLLAANEGHVLRRASIEKLYLSTGSDLRKSIMELNYWCQVAVGSEKSGLDWMINRWPIGADLDPNGEKLRVLSRDTYRDHMGWFSRDILMSNGPTAKAELQEEMLHWWGVSPQDADSMEDLWHQSCAEPSVDASKLELVDNLRYRSDQAELRSVLDALAASCSSDARKDAIDASIPPVPEKQKLNYVEGYHLLNADLAPDYTTLKSDIGSTFEVFLGSAFREPHEPDSETRLASTALAAGPRPRAIHPPGVELCEALLPIMKPGCPPPPNAGAETIVDHSLRNVAEDLGPYVRAIMAFDLRLEQYRLELSRLLPGNGRGTKRIRTTRASRAALEGGNKAETRKERWFSSAINVPRVLATGKKEWQDLLVQNDYFTVPVPGEQQTRENSEPISESANDKPASYLPRPSSAVHVFPRPRATHRFSSMSLFGTSPDDSSVADSARRSKSSLFADEPSVGGGSTHFGSSSLFADDDGLSSPWSNTGKRTSKHQLVKSLLPDSDVPESYIDAYDLVLSAGERAGTGVGLTSVREILSGSGLTATNQAKILNLVLSGDTERSNGLGRGEFNVLLALIGLAQEGDDLTFDAVDDRRKKLPVPTSSYLDALHGNQEPAMSAPAQERPTTPPPPPSDPIQAPSSVQSRRSGRDGMGGLDADPWGSPQLHRGHAHAQNGHEQSTLNGFGTVRSGTNAWSSTKASDGANPIEHADASGTSGRPDTHNSNSSGFGWGDNFPQTSESAGIGGGPVRAGLEDFGRSGNNHNETNPSRRAPGIDRVTTSQVKEVVTVSLLPEKEGIFMFQHRNYEVKSARRGSTVVRRYSDFVWLLDCLHKRYPFRQLPLLPPKRIAVNGTHLAADSTSFLEKRRRGLVRFANSLVQHPVLSQEQLVIMFLTVPTELSVWRKQATISVQDEFTGRVLPPDLEDSLPSTLTDTFDTVRSGVKKSAEVYINLCTLLERLAKRNEGLAADHLRFSLALQSLTEMTRETYAIDTNDVPLLNEGIKATSRHLSASQSLLEDEARAWEDGMLEDLKRQRDSLVSVREMFDRRDRYARNNIPQLERRIETNERKLQDLRARAQGTVKPGEIEKVEESIFKDKESIVQQHARGVFIKECIRDELVYFQQSQYHISRLHQDWSQERVKYSELQADNWRSLSEQVEGMPLGD